MRPSAALAAHREEVRRIVSEHGVGNPRVFGSAARFEDTSASDLDLVVDASPDTTLFDIGAVRVALLDLLGVPVDVVTPAALPAAVRDEVLREAVPV